MALKVVSKEEMLDQVGLKFDPGPLDRNAAVAHQ